MTEFVFVLQGVDARQPGHRASDWTKGMAATAHRRTLTATC